MVETGEHEGPPTHAVTFVWNGQEVIDEFISNSTLSPLAEFDKFENHEPGRVCLFVTLYTKGT